MADADATLNQIFTGDPSKLLSAYKQVVAENIRLEQANQRMAQGSKRASEEAVKGQNRVVAAMEGGLRTITSFASGWISLGGAVTVVNKALDEHEERLRRAREGNLSVGDAQAKVIKNLASSTTAQKQSFLADISDIQRRTGFQDLGQLYLAAASGASASAGDVAATRSAVEASAVLSRDAPEDLASLVGGALDLSKASGLKDAKRNLGYLLTVGTEARVVDLRKQAENIAPAVSAASKTVGGDRLQAVIDAGALFAALSAEGVDPSGETTRTAVMTITGQLREFFTQGVKYKPEGALVSQRVQPAFDPNTLEGRLRVLQDDPRLRQVFLETASFGRERFRIPFEQLLMRGETDRAFRQARQNIRFDEGVYRQMEGELAGATPQIAISRIAKESEASAQQAVVRRTPEAIRGQAKEILDKALADTRGYGDLGLLAPVLEPLLGRLDEGVFGTVEEAISMYRGRLGQRAAEIRRRNTSLLGGAESDAPVLAYADLTESERAAYDNVQKQITLLGQLLDELKSLNKSNAEMNDRDKQAKPAAAPAIAGERGRGRER